MASQPRLRFGTDGLRARADAFTPELLRELGRAAAHVLGRDRWLIGRDPRESSPAIEAALAAGLADEGVDVTLLGVLPTPAVACASREWDAPAAVISASHNTYVDNGVKLFAAGGRKLADDVQAEIERLLDADGIAPAAAPGVVTSDEAFAQRYVDWLVSTMEGRRLDGLTMVVDGANGAAAQVGPALFEALGASVIAINVSPDGRNINEGCGSQHPEGAREAVLAAGADIGLALDGDGDRVFAIDSTGGIVDGDQIMAMCAIDLRDRGRLTDDTVVVTVMSNLGLRIAMRDAGIALAETPVGDRYVLEELDDRGLSLGGEQSGHVIFHDLAPTGDGLLTSLRVLDLMRRSGRTLTDLAAVMTRFPQVLVNVPVPAVGDVADAMADEIAEAERRLAGRGRVLIRPSGTEPLVRVMVEAPTEAEAKEVAERLADVVARVAAASS
ncbi:MAG TPA: phosphoglucosamine mutase [Acidimicrobiales bacterium]|nr:phosphoglucosamine mutase [Acidimicrobiales bacterium]